MTKHDQILALRWKGLSNAEIAARVGCSTDYVRAVWQRADHPGRYAKRESERKFRRYWSDPEHRESHRAHCREAYRRSKRDPSQGEPA